MHRESTAVRTEFNPVARAVAHGLAQRPRRLPPWLFYDQRGSELFEDITALPEYYLTRAEAELFATHGAELMAAAAADAPATVIELGAGTATKTQVLLRALVARQGAVTFVPVDVSATPLEAARTRLAAEEPQVKVWPWVSTHDDAFPRLRGLGGRKIALFIGSSIGNYDDGEALELLRGLRHGLTAGDALVLGTDLRKDPEVLVRAYDDAAGVTAAFNKNVLTRINRELGGHFNLDCFRHVAVWNPAASRMEMHLESVGEQAVRIDGLGMIVRLHDGERIHTESSVKYDEAMVERLLAASGYRRERTFTDAEGRFAVHLARAIGAPFVT